MIKSLFLTASILLCASFLYAQEGSLKPSKNNRDKSSVDKSNRAMDKMHSKASASSSSKFSTKKKYSGTLKVKPPKTGKGS
jgi:hypothetical protein